VFWAWIATAVLLALCEAVTGGLYVIPWSLGALSAAALEALGVATSWQWIAFVCVSSVVLVVVQRVRHHRHQREERPL
jgi:membrane protein implicated in regulation of membrane protease activity